MSSILLDIEWLLSTLFDASLLTFEPPETAAPFFRRTGFGPDPADSRRAPLGTHGAALMFLRFRTKALILLAMFSRCRMLGRAEPPG